MEDVAPLRSTEQVKIEVDHEHVFVLCNNDERQQLEEVAVRRSKLLTDLLESKPGSQATLPVDAGCLDGWRKYVQLQTEESSLSNVAEHHDMLMLVKVRLRLREKHGHRRSSVDTEPSFCPGSCHARP